jgi:hypothetical protein
MRSRYNLHLMIWVIVRIFISGHLLAQPVVLERGSVAFLDSIDRRIISLQNQVTRLRQVRDVAYYNMQRELDLTLFLKDYEKYVAGEDLDSAKRMVETRLEKARLKGDQYAVKYFSRYKDDAYALIKQQRMYYQQLFSKERNFKREFAACLDEENPETYKKAERMTSLALEYARENNLTETIQYLETYHAFVQSLIYDEQCEYDLKKLTGNSKEFEKVFLPYIAADSIGSINKARELVEQCRNYGRLTHSALKEDYFKQQELVVTSALSEILDRQGKESELSRYTDQAVTARFDTVNPLGIFKWHDRIVVIDEFIPSSSMENVKKGEAIILSDRMLATYLRKNKLCESVENLRLGYAFIIPYRSASTGSSFYFNPSTQKWQFITCYTVVNNSDFTAQISKFMAPLFFKEENGLSENQVQ